MLTLIEDKKKHDMLIVQMDASIDYMKPFWQETFNLEGSKDSLAFLTGGEIIKIVDVTSSSDINTDMLKNLLRS